MSKASSASAFRPSSSPTRPTACATAAPTDGIPPPCPRISERHRAGMPQSACEYGEVIGRELRAQGFDMTLGGGMDLTREPAQRPHLRVRRRRSPAGRNARRQHDEVRAGATHRRRHQALRDERPGNRPQHCQRHHLEARHAGVRPAGLPYRRSPLPIPALSCAPTTAINGDYACENTYTLNESSRRSGASKAS